MGKQGKLTENVIHHRRHHEVALSMLLGGLVPERLRVTAEHLRLAEVDAVLLLQPVAMREFKGCEGLREFKHWILLLTSLKISVQIRLDAQQERAHGEHQLDLQINSV